MKQKPAWADLTACHNTMMFFRKWGQSECKVTIVLQVQRQTEGSVVQSQIHVPAVKRFALCRRRDYFVTCLGLECLNRQPTCCTDADRAHA